MYQSAIIGSEPHRSVLGAIAGNHNVGCKATTGLVENLCLTCLGRELYDTTVIGTKPIVAIGVGSSSVNIAKFKCLETKQFLDILVQTATIAGYPHVTSPIEHQFLLGVLAYRCGIVLVVYELLHLAILQVYNIYTIVVGGKPHPASLVHTSIPHLQILW